METQFIPNLCRLNINKMESNLFFYKNHLYKSLCYGDLALMNTSNKDGQIFCWNYTNNKIERLHKSEQGVLVKQIEIAIFTETTSKEFLEEQNKD